MKEKEEEITNLKNNVQVLTSSKNFIKKSFDSLQNKLKKIQSENFLIPKVKKEEEKKDDVGGLMDDDLSSIL